MRKTIEVLILISGFIFSLYVFLEGYFINDMMLFIAGFLGVIYFGVLMQFYFLSSENGK